MEHFYLSIKKYFESTWYCCFWIKKADLEKISGGPLTSHFLLHIFFFQAPSAHKHGRISLISSLILCILLLLILKTFLMHSRSVPWSVEIFLDCPVVKSKGCLSQKFILACIAVYISQVEFVVMALWYVLVNSHCPPLVVDSFFLNHSLIASKLLLLKLSLLMSWNFGCVH